MNRVFGLLALAGVCVALMAPRGAEADRRPLIIRGDVIGGGVKDGSSKTTFTFKDRHSGRVVHQAVTELEVKGGTYVAEMDPGDLDPNGVYVLEAGPAAGTMATFVALQTSTPGTPDVGHANISGTLIAGIFKGNGSQLTNLDAGAVASGTLDNLRLDSKVMLTFQNESINAVHTYTAKPAFNASGSPFTVANTGKVANLNADLLDGLSAADLQGGGVPNPLTLSGSNGAQIIKGENSNSGAGSSGVVGFSSATSGLTYGVRGTTYSPSGSGLFASATSTTGTNQGVSGWSSSTSGRGVYGYALATTGTTYGVYGNSNSSSGAGVYGVGKKYGGRFTNSASAGVGILGEATATTSSTYGIRGQAASKDGIGVSGVNTATSGFAFGGYFSSNSPNGYGVYGVALKEIGTDYGVAGQADIDSNGYGVMAYGDLGATGNKSFRIDHPLDPENKYLVHYAAESPMPQNFYTGNITTDSKGYAWVQLPDYFQEINTNFKYQLTVIDEDGSGFAQVKVAKRIRDNRFLIMSSQPNVTVSWEVKADRNDLYERRKKPRDVVVKSESERGKYQHPELYGFGPERGLLNPEQVHGLEAPPR